MKDLTQGNIVKTFFLFGFPLVIAGLLSQSYATINSIIAGKYLGEHGLAATGSIGPLITFTNAIVWGYNTGFGIYIAKLFGSKQYSKIKSSIYTNIVVMFIFCALLAVFLIAFNKPIFDALNVKDELRADALSYFIISIAFKFVLMAPNLFVMVLQGFGLGTFPLVVSLISGFLSVIANIISVTILKMGVSGLAVSSVIVGAITSMLYFFKLRVCFKEMNVHKEKVKLGFSHIKESLSYAVPSMLQQGVMYLAGLTISPLVNKLSKSELASRSIADKLYDILATVYQNSTRAFTNYAAQCTGHKEYKKIKKGIVVGLIQSSCFLFPFLLACVVFARPVCGLFLNKEAAPETIVYAMNFARIYLPFVYLNLFNNLFHGLYRAVKANVHLFVTTLFGALARFVATAIFIGGMHIYGFFLGWVIAWAAELVLTTILYFLGKWNPERKEPKLEEACQ